MRIKIIGNNNCARATRRLLRMAGFAVTESLSAEAITPAPHFGYTITIDLAPALHPPQPASMPDHSTHGQPAEADREASPPWGGASSSFDKLTAVGIVSTDGTQAERSEERRVGKECRSRW